MKGFFIYGTILPREWYVTKQMESGLDMNTMLDKLNNIFDDEANDIVIVTHFINTRNGEELILGELLPNEENNHTSTVKVPEIHDAAKMLVMKTVSAFFRIDTEFNLYYVGEYFKQ